MQKDYDVIIIGAGIAGLVAGNFLLDKGKRVLIVEKNAYPGGCACSFTRGGYKFDAAVHWISQAGEGGVVRDILSRFGLQDAVRFVQLPGPPSVWQDGLKLTLSYGRDALTGTLGNAFPGEKAAIEKFWAEVSETKDELWRLIHADPGKMKGLGKAFFNLTFPLKFRRIAKYHKRPAKAVIEGCFKDPKLRRAAKIMGIFPGISFVHYSWFNLVALDGDAYYPIGGIQAVPDALARRFMDNGGEIRYRTLAERILVESGRAAGVALKDAGAIRSDVVISAGDARNTLLNMLGDAQLTEGFGKAAREWRPSESFFYVYLGVDMDLRKTGFDGRPIWYFPKRINKDAFPMLGGDAIGIGMPSVIDPSLAPDVKGIIILGMLASCTFMDGCPVRSKGESGKEAYRAVKERIADYMIELAGEAIPDLREKIEVKIAASPHTFERYTMNYMGASSGWSMAAEHQHKLPVKTPIPGLYLAGHWTMNPGGVPAAFVSGKMAADAIITS